MADVSTLNAAVEAANLIRRLRARIEWLEGTLIPHARKQENANGFQKGWHAALSRVSEGDDAGSLAALVPEPRTDVDGTLPWPLQIPVWKCRACGCLWRDNFDDTVSLLNADQKSCDTCEHTHTKKACEIHWLSVEMATPPNAEAGAVDKATSVGAQTSSARIER